MNYFASSAWNYVAKLLTRVEVSRTGCRVLVTVPSLPERCVLAMAEIFTSKSSAANYALTFKVADVVWCDWTSQGRGRASDFGWLDESGSLTLLRNEAPVPGKTNLVVLCGADRVPDAGGLSDFHKCDPVSVWRDEMRSSFAGWLHEKLSEVGVNHRTAELKSCDRLLVPLLEQGRADLVSIGEWLEDLDLSGAQELREVQEVILVHLDRFQLPRFPGFPLAKRNATLGPYIEKAGAFFSFTMFLDARDRERAAKAIAGLAAAVDCGEATGVPLEEPLVRGDYADGRSFLAGLGRYIDNEEASDRSRLMTCDFVTIADKILKFRTKNPPPQHKGLRRLSGSPTEVVLHAVWQALREFSRDKRSENDEIGAIAILGRRFRHDYEPSSDEEEQDGALDRSILAGRYLRRLLGGVDGLVGKHLTLRSSSGEPVPVSCSLVDERVTPVYAKTAEPQLEFSVQLIPMGGGGAYETLFAWRLPETQPHRLAEAMVQWASTAISSHGATWTLPVFHVPYFEEILRATDDEDTRRVLLHCLRDSESGEPCLTNVFAREWLATTDPLLPNMKLLSECYRKFIQAASERGLHDALFSGEWAQLRQAYAAICRRIVDEPIAAESQMKAMLLRAFLLVRRRHQETGVAWGTEPFEPSALTTVLHPAVLEMLEAQVLFLFSCFNAAAVREQKRDDRRHAFAERPWTSYVDLSTIQTPLVGLLFNEDLNLDTSVRGHGLVHRLGSPAESDASLSTRLLVRYEGAGDDDEVSDAEMFRESRESRLLFRLMTDYFRLHPHARDGLALAVFRNQDIQPIIAAVHQYVNTLADKRNETFYVLSPQRRKPYALAVTVFSETGDEAGVSRWIEQWRQRWEAAETEPKLEGYRACRLSVAHRIVEARHLGAFQRLINDSFEADIAVLYDFIHSGQGGNRFVEVAPFDVRERTLKFPILEKPCVVVNHPTDSYKRSRIISNRQFSAGTLHSQVMHRLKNQGVQAGREYVVLGVGDFAPWRLVVDALHAKAEWVVCIDPSMDERLIKTPALTGATEREIIGFGSGVGSHGEANFTVSTQQFSLADVKARLAESIREVYSGAGWSSEDRQRVSEGILRQACELSGLSLVRATGVGHYVRDFMAYALTRKMLREQPPVLCDNIVSLDAYRHWFDSADSERRPDLLWLVARLDDENRIRIDARLVECKVARRSEQHLLKAKTQISNGLRVLIPAFAPSSILSAGGVDDSRPDQRYWWLQLHRLIASKAETDAGGQSLVLSALERLAEGDYSIDWGASVFAFWSDDSSGEPTRVGSWQVSGVEGITADIYSVGSEFVRSVSLGAAGYPKSWVEWEQTVAKSNTNVCDTFVDVEDGPGEDDDEDLPGWDEHVADEFGEKEDDAGFTPEPQQEPESDSQVVQGNGSALVAADLVGSVWQSVPVEGIDAVATAPAVSVPGDTASSPAPVVAGALQVELSTDGARGQIPERVLLGKRIEGGKPVYWEFGHRELANRHMLIFGTSGMGKTYAVQAILGELARLGQNSLVIDYTDGFIPSKLEEVTKATLAPTQHFIQQKPLPINPFKAQVSEEAGLIFKDDPFSIAKRVAAVFTSVYGLGNQQFPVLIDAMTEGLQQRGDAFTLDAVLEVLQSYIDDGIHANNPVRSSISKLKPFIQSNPFAPSESGVGWSEIFSDVASRCHVFQFYKVDRHSARALIEFVLWDLYSFVSTFGDKDTPRVVVLDEVQNLDLGPDAPVAKYLTEGRKHGLGLVTATQTVKGVGGVNDARVSRFFMAEQKLFFRPTENEMREHAQLLHNAVSTVSVQEWTTRLANLLRGECWALGRVRNEVTGKLAVQANRIKITSLEDRGFHA